MRVVVVVGLRVGMFVAGPGGVTSGVTGAVVVVASPVTGETVTGVRGWVTRTVTGGLTRERTLGPPSKSPSSAAAFVDTLTSFGLGG